jgi:hypothetical protein
LKEKLGSTLLPNEIYDKTEILKIMKKNKFLFAAVLLAMASFCRPSPAQTTECGTDNGCYAHYTKITKTSSENTCTNNSDTYVVRADVLAGEFPPFSITVDGASF